MARFASLEKLLAPYTIAVGDKIEYYSYIDFETIDDCLYISWEVKTKYAWWANDISKKIPVRKIIRRFKKEDGCYVECLSYDRLKVV